MIQSCAVDLVGLNVFDRPFEGFSTEDSKPVGGLISGVHLLLVLPQALTASTLPCCGLAKSKLPLKPGCILSAGMRCSSISRCPCWRRSERMLNWVTLAKMAAPPFQLEA